MERKSLMLHYLEGSFEAYMECGINEAKAFELAMLSTIKKYKQQPLFRSLALELEANFKEYGPEKISW